MTCEQCGGPTFDNRQKVSEGWKGPIFKCKDRSCGWVKWPPKGQKQAPKGDGARGERSQGSGAARRPLGPLYFESMKVAKATLEQFATKGTWTVADLVAATATIFIGANQTNTPVLPPKVVPPKPAPPPEPDDQDERYIEEDAGDQGLPF